VDWIAYESMIPHGGEAGNKTILKEKKCARDYFALQWKGEVMTRLLTQACNSTYN